MFKSRKARGHGKETTIRVTTTPVTMAMTSTPEGITETDTATPTTQFVTEPTTTKTTTQEVKGTAAITTLKQQLSQTTAARLFPFNGFGFRIVQTGEIEIPVCEGTCRITCGNNEFLAGKFNCTLPEYCCKIK